VEGRSERLPSALAFLLRRGKPPRFYPPGASLFYKNKERAESLRVSLAPEREAG